MKYLVQWMILTNYQIIHGVLEWIVFKKVTGYGQNVTLFCNVSNCCPKLAGWDRWTPSQRTLYIDVKTGRPNKKYDGKVLKGGYTLVIQNLTKEDLNVSYSCLYGVTLGERKFYKKKMFLWVSTVLSADENEDMPLISTDPSPPQGLKAEVEMIGIRLTWDPPSCQVSKYQIERITDGHKDLMDSSAEETSHLISDVFPSQMYYFAIKLCYPLPPHDLKATAGVNGIYLTWNPPLYPTFLHMYPKPLPPNHLKAASDFEGIHITWSIPEYPVIDKIHHFILEVNREIINVAPDKTCWIISNVYPSTNYTIRMATSARSGMENKSDCNRSSRFQTESEYTEKLKCKSDICEETKVKEEKKNFLRLEKLFQMTNSAVIKKIEDKISDTNLEITHLDTAEHFLSSLSKDQKESIYCTTDNYVTKSSIDYDLVLLLRFWLSSNEQEVPTMQFDKMPDIDDKSIQADLSRIFLTRKRYHPLKLISATDLKYVYMAVVRLWDNKLREQYSQVFRQKLIANDEKNGNQNTLKPFLQDKETHSNEPYRCACQGMDINVLNNREMSALKYACISGHTNIVSTLLDNNADFSTVYQDGKTPLVIAFEENHDHIITLLRNKGFDIESTNKLGQTALAMACTNGDKDTGWVPLSRACKRGSEEIVKVLLLKETIDLNIEDNDGWTPLKKASLNGHSEIVDILLNTHKLEIDKADNDGWTPLMSSCQKGHVTVSELLLCNNADVNHRSNDGVTPLMTATQNDHIPVINLLLENNADVDLDNNDGWTPLRVACNANTEKAGYTPLKIACRNGYYKISSLLIEAGADVNRKDNDGWTPVQTACKTGHLKICKLLLSHKADINIENFSRCTPLHIASRNGQTDIVEWLLKNNAKIDQLNDAGWTALMSACQFGYKNITNLLLKNGSCVNHQSVKKLTPLIAACQNNSNEVMDVLIKNEANVNVCNVDGWTPLHFTCMRGHIKASEILIQNGADILINAKADVNVVDKDGWTPLKTACRVGDEDTVEVLLNNNADINKEDKEGWTPLKSASVHEHYKIVKRLLLKNADMNKVDHEGWTSLMSACKVGNFKVINILLEYGADVNCYSESTGDTPLTIACTYSDGGEIIKLLLEKGADWKKPNNIGQTALILACMHGKTQNVSKLLDYRVDTDVTDKNCVSPLKAACHGLYREIVELLIKAGANIDIADLNGYTPLISACETQNLQLVELLIHNKADVDKSTPGGWNPYLIAIKTHNDEIANFLIKKGADKSKASLLKARAKKVVDDNRKIVLDSFRSYLNKADSNGYTPLTAAASQGHVQLIELLITNGADVDIFDERGKSPIMYACESGDLRTVKVTGSPLILAKQANAFDIVDYFIENEIELKHEDLLSISNTESVTMACKYGFKALLESIIDEKN
ncbi:unnamed protein product [Mytilus edulis]|uniref:Fibronectin type-III domain-containing protein n=1 Tax=Mytilus edulis TaxID=6550 RepID=A0A8S3RUV9_MYTED|nr:unnamed protein product [Mytilus edulis]